MKKPFIFAGSSHIPLAQEICSELSLTPGKTQIGTFPDGEISVRILEDVSNREVFVLQSLGINPSQYLLELLIIIDALKRASAKRITAIIPYFGFARQDRRNKPGDPITAKLIANLLTEAGATHLITLDLHADQIEGFFDIPVLHLHAQDLLIEHAQKKLGKNGIVVIPDLGNIKIGETAAKSLHCDLAIVKKERLDAFQVKTTLIGHVKDKNVLIIDDLCSTGGTITSAAKLCRDNGALKIIGAVTHGVLVSEAMKKIEESSIETLFITNSIEQTHRTSPKIQQVSIGKMIARSLE